MNPAGQSSISSLYHAATEQIGLQACNGLQHQLQPSIEALCQQTVFASLLADKALLSDCMTLAETAPLPAEVLTNSLTAETLELIPLAAKPLALLLHLVILSLPCDSSVNPRSPSSNIDLTAASANGCHHEQQNNAACPTHDAASLILCLQAAQQPVSQQADMLSPQQEAEQLLTLMHSALLVLKLATIADHSQATKAQCNHVTRMLWTTSLQLVLSIQQHYKACLSTSERQHSNNDASHDVSKPLAAAQHCARLLLELLTKTVGQLVREQNPISAHRAQACFKMMHMLLSEDESLCQGSATASKLISWGKALTSDQNNCNASASASFTRLK